MFIRLLIGVRYRENSKHEQRITLPIQIRSNLFGVHLEELMGYDGEKGGVPRVVKDCAQYLRQSGALVIGHIFNQSLISLCFARPHRRGFISTFPKFRHFAASEGGL
jgi:hypothetical protein